jgi:SM-20-related protein
MKMKKTDVVKWLNDKQISDSAVKEYRVFLSNSCPNHIVIDDLFDESALDEVVKVLQQPHHWKTQQHTYSALYVDSVQWQNTSENERFVQRDVWLRGGLFDHDVEKKDNANVAQDFLSFLRGDEFRSVLSRIFNVQLTDMNVTEPEINTNYFRLATTDFVEQHADDSPGREVCMLLYLNKYWNNKAGGELSFIGDEGKDDNLGKSIGKSNSITIAPLYNRCVLFDPSSKGSEHWVEKLNAEHADQYRYNVTSWYWTE